MFGWAQFSALQAVDAVSSHLSGKVLDDSGNPLGGAVVQLEQDGWEIARTNTSPTGDYTVPVELSDSPVWLSVKQTDFVPVRTNVLLRMGQSATADFALHDDTSVAGTVLALDKTTPLASVVVQAIRLDTNQVSGGSVSKAKPMASVSPSPDLETAPLQPGLMGEYYQLEVMVSDFPRSETLGLPTVRRADQSINFEGAGGTLEGTELADHLYVRWTGLLRIPRTGRYTFYLNSYDGSRLFLDGQRVVDNGGNHDWQEKSGDVQLAAGDHWLRIEYFHGAGPRGCKFSWASDAQAKEIVPMDALAHHHASWPEPPLAAGRPARTVLTDEKGAYRLRRLTVGRYQVRCHVLGGIVTNQEPITIEASLSARTIPHSVDFHVAPFKKGTWKTYTARDGLPANVVNEILPDPDESGMIWFGTAGGFSRFDGKQFVNLTMASGLPDTSVVDVLREPNGIVWMAGSLSRGVIRYNPATGELSDFTKQHGLGGGYPGCLARDGKGAIWMTVAGGVARYDGQTLQTFMGAEYPWAAGVSHMVPDAEGNIWFSNTGRGVSRYDGAHVTTLTTVDGLVHNRIHSIYKDRDRTLWFGASHLANGTLTNLTEVDGLVPGSAIEAIHRDANGVFVVRNGLFQGNTRYWRRSVAV